MTSIRANCLTPTCADVPVELSADFRPGMMAGRCDRCGTAWRLMSGQLYEIVSIDPAAPPADH